MLNAVPAARGAAEPVPLAAAGARLPAPARPGPAGAERSAARRAWWRGPDRLSPVGTAAGRRRPVPRRAGARDDRGAGEPGAGHARQPDLRRQLPPARRPAQAAGVPHAARLHGHRQQLLHQPAARGGGRAALRPGRLLPLRGWRHRPLLRQGRLRPGLRGRLRLLRALRQQGLSGEQRLRYVRAPRGGGRLGEAGGEPGGTSTPGEEAVGTRDAGWAGKALVPGGPPRRGGRRCRLTGRARGGGGLLSSLAPPFLP